MNGFMENGSVVVPKFWLKTSNFNGGHGGEINMIINDGRHSTRHRQRRRRRRRRLTKSTISIWPMAELNKGSSEAHGRLRQTSLRISRLDFGINWWRLEGWLWHRQNDHFENWRWSQDEIYRFLAFFGAKPNRLLCSFKNELHYQLQPLTWFMVDVCSARIPRCPFPLSPHHLSSFFIKINFSKCDLLHTIAQYQLAFNNNNLHSSITPCGCAHCMLSYSVRPKLAL